MSDDFMTCVPDFVAWAWVVAWPSLGIACGVALVWLFALRKTP